MNLNRIRELIEAYKELLYSTDSFMVSRDSNKILEAIVAAILKEIESV